MGWCRSRRREEAEFVVVRPPRDLGGYPDEGLLVRFGVPRLRGSDDGTMEPPEGGTPNHKKAPTLAGRRLNGECLPQLDSAPAAANNLIYQHFFKNCYILIIFLQRVKCEYA